MTLHLTRHGPDGGTRAPSRTTASGLALPALVALVVGSMIGSGIFALPSQMAGSAAPGPLLIGWTITGVGMLMLAFVFQRLAERKPDVDGGVYGYAREGFGEYVGFSSAYLDHGLPTARRLGTVTADELATYRFPAGSMGPKVQAASGFAERTGREAVIGALEDIADIVAGTAGTRVVPSTTG